MSESKPRLTSASPFRLATTYFILTFLTGFTFGIIRELLLIPAFHLPTSRAKLLEAPFMLLAVLFWSHNLINHYSIPRLPYLRLQIGVLALCMMVSSLQVMMVETY